MNTLQNKLPDLETTIIAISSAQGSGARAIVRMSGRRAGAIASTLCADLNPVSLRQGHFFQGLLRVNGFHAPVPADIYSMAAPHTYTGQDVIEMHVIGCTPLVQVIITQCLNAGARAALAGEFTMRAFLAGKLDLTRAEAVLGVIDATERQDLRLALKQLAGGMTQPLGDLREDLLNLLADVEAALDFTEEGIHFVATSVLLQRLAKGLAYVTLLRKQIEQQVLGLRPFRVVLAGPPNAGKSSLFNALSGQGTALVSSEPGTTRDYLEKNLSIEGIPIQIVDTAGQHETEDMIEQSAQYLGQVQVQTADLILWCCPTGNNVPVPFCFGTSTAECWRIATKADLEPPDSGLLATSAKTLQGLSELRERLMQRVRHSGHVALAPSLSRCRHHIESCWQHLRNAHRIVLNEDPPELLALELRLALEELGAMTGVIYTDDLLDRIFSRFCIGK